MKKINTKTKKWRIVNWAVIGTLVLVLAGLGFIFLNPDYNLYMVRSGSMEPGIMTGDIIVTGPLSSSEVADLEIGTIITYERLGELITHRVHSFDEELIFTKGDAVEDRDSWSVSMSDIKGTYLFKIPYVGYVTNFVRTKLGWFLTIILPATILVGWLAKDIVKEALKSDA